MSLYLATLDLHKFHHRYGIQYEGGPRLLPMEVDIFRVKRLNEEVVEYAEAMDLKDKLDALVDLTYIALGNAHLHGFTPHIMHEAWKRVHEANMKKERASKENPGRYGSSIDIVKPPGWKPPNFDDLLL